MLDPGNVFDFNRYMYVRGNPMKFNDPSGHDPGAAVTAGDGGLPWYAKWLALYDAGEYDQLSGEIRVWLMEHQNIDQILTLRDELGGYTEGYGSAIISEFDDQFGRAMAYGDLPGLKGDPIAEAYKQGFGKSISTGGWGIEGPLSGVDYVSVRGGQGGCSFSAKTVVATEDGFKSIVSIHSGDKVLAWNQETSEIGYYTVTAAHLHLDHTLVYLTIDGETILTTPEHPFFTESGQWVGAGELQIGSRVQQIDGDLGAVRKVEVVEQPQVMYNLSVDQAHTFVVGDGQWLVHNQGPCPMTGDQQALKEIVDEATLGGRKPLTVDQAETVLDWADEVGYPGWRAGPGDVSTPSNWVGGSHIHIPGVGSGHIPVNPGVGPR